MSNTTNTDAMKRKLLQHEELSIRFGNGSGDGQAYCSIKGIEACVAQKVLEGRIDEVKRARNSNMARINTKYVWARLDELESLTNNIGGESLEEIE